jgi:glycine cleavage system H lipoate-binding protein
MHDPYLAKALEYLLGIAFLVLFSGFWVYATGQPKVAERLPAAVKLPARLPLLDMFRLPEGVMLHPGHAWARPLGAHAPGVVAVGMDDFAQQLVGPLASVKLPPVGSSLEQGSRGWQLMADARPVDMLSPITGRVLEINEAALRRPATVNEDPYGRGWLMKVESPRLGVNTKQLLAGRAARDLMSSSWDDLSAMLSPKVGLVMHDGGAPLTGFARALDEQNWDAVARRFLLT